MVGLDRVRGQSAATARLKALLAGARVPHALLLEGPDGVGKMLAAKTFAQLLLCRTPRDGTACGACSGCVKVEAGTHPDLEIVAAEGRHTKIDAIRDAERTLRLRPMEGGRRALIVEDAHRLTLGAQNALLKTLEEPPPETVLLLTTSRLKALLPTVVSRCQRVAFGPVPDEVVAALLEGDDGVEPATARWVARLSQGSVGRARAASPEDLGEQRRAVAEIDARLDPLGSSPIAAAMQSAQELHLDRAQLAETLDLWLVWLRDQLVYAWGIEAPAEDDALGSDLRRLAQRGPAELLVRARSVLEARRQLDLPYNLNAQLIAEQLCLALVGRGRMVPVPA